MKWNNGYSASYYAYIIDPVSWREKERIEITVGSISRSEDGPESLPISSARHTSKGRNNIYASTLMRGRTERLLMSRFLLALPQVHRGILTGISRRIRWNATPS